MVKDGLTDDEGCDEERRKTDWDEADGMKQEADEVIHLMTKTYQLPVGHVVHSLFSADMKL